jgi:hypothetical protein
MPLLAIERTIDHISGVSQCRCQLTIEVGIIFNDKQAQADLRK